MFALVMSGNPRPERRPEELIATFGEARIVRSLDGKLEIKDGSPEDREQAQTWMQTFLLQHAKPRRP